MHIKKNIILASSSPRRKALLKQIGIDFDVRESNIFEVFDFTKSPEENVQELALQKANAVIDSVENAIIIGADTIVVLNDQILGKPKTFDDAVNMLEQLSGETHKVFTGLALVDVPTKHYITVSETTSVMFRQLESDEIYEYVASGSPMDKAGAYGIQDDYGAVFVEKIEGCFYNVVGFPLARFIITLKKFQRQLGL